MKITNEIYNQAVEDIQRDNESFNEKAKELFPKNADLAGPVAAAHASLERALNNLFLPAIRYSKIREFISGLIKP